MHPGLSILRGMLELLSITRTYELGGERAGIFGVSLSVAQGQVAVLAGPPGRGHATLLQDARPAGPPQEGEVRLDGELVSTLPERQRCDLRLRKLGFVFQSFNLVPVLDACENVMLPLQLQGMAEETARTRAGEMLERVGLSDRLKHRPGQLSGGQQQRVAIARALVGRPRLVLADEPTANLDHAHGGPLLDLMALLSRETGAAFLVASHDPAVIGRADCVFRLEDGRRLES